MTYKEVVVMILRYVDLLGLVCPCVDGVGVSGTRPGAIFFGITRASSALTQESEGKERSLWKSNLTGLLLAYLPEDVLEDHNAAIELLLGGKGIEHMSSFLQHSSRISNSPVALMAHMPDHFAVITHNGRPSRNFSKSRESIITSSSEQHVALDELCLAFSAMPLPLDSISKFISYVLKDPKRSFKGSFVTSFVSSIAATLG
ncbi:hypothetical protein M9H77_03676 [Catharanthus roseus]|uniref:Uncharacterized protein n=1 Tax=Catharanthus roseus TaxID=4058 RepID=A0ACC0CBU1_CATRO|nr:hypothetical protein M9H77_03676 [Catharanthus roseus]